jgi:hypothetical protein
LGSLDHDYTTRIIEWTGIKTGFELLKNKGLVFNLQRFPGTIEIKNSTFSKNMAYIRDVLIEEYDLRQIFLNPKNIKYSDFVSID